MHDVGGRAALDHGGGVPASLGIVDDAVAAPAKGFTFLLISDSHMGFDKPATPM